MFNAIRKTLVLVFLFQSMLLNANAGIKNNFKSYKPFAAGGKITIATSGVAEGNGWTFANNTITATADVSISAADVVSKLGLGNLTIIGSSVTISGNITSTSANSLTIKSAGEIVFSPASKISTQGGSVILWADADGSGAGDIYFATGTAASILTNGGHLWLGGGAGSTTWNGLTVGDGFAIGDAARSVNNGTFYTGITIESTNISTSGGHIKMRGKGKPGNITSGITTYSGGMYVTKSGTMNSGGGDIYIEAVAQTGSGQHFGFYYYDAYTFNPGSGNLTILGDASASSSGNFNLCGSGIFIWTSVPQISSSGNITLIGKKSTNASTFGVDIRKSISTTGGNIIIESDPINIAAALSASGLIDISSTTGNINLGGNITTTSTSFDAIILNAGKSSSAGTTSGGDIVVSPTPPTISTGTGGIAKFYSGSENASSRLTTLVGGSTNVRKGVDENSTLNPALSAGKYALYRESSSSSTPTISTSGTLTAFTTCSGSVSASQSFIVSGSSLAANVTVSAPTGYEVSLQSGIGYASSIVITASGTLANTTLYVRLSSNATGSPSGNITVESTNATTKNVAVSGSVNAAPVAPVAESTQLFCINNESTFKYAKIIFSDVKNFASANSIQIAEWRWLNGTNVIPQAGTTLTNPGGSNPGGEQVSNLFDGSISTKWLDFNIKSSSTNNKATVVFTFPDNGYEINGYSWTTANDATERDPKSWKVYLSNDGSNWTEVHTVSNFNATNSRFTSAGTWNFTPPSSNTGTLMASALSGNSLKWYTTATGGTVSTTLPEIDLSVLGTTNYFVSQVNASGCESQRTKIEAVVAASPEIAYTNSSYRFERTKSINPVQPTSTGGTVVSYSITPSLPDGLSFDIASGEISGTPSTMSSATSYTISASTEEGCTTTASISVEVFNAIPPSNLRFSPATQTVRLNSAITNMNPTVSGGAVASYTISPSLPAGLTINSTTGIIGGTLTSSQTGSVTYTITATNSGGSTTAQIILIYNTAPTDITLDPTSIDENKVVGSNVGTLTATDADVSDTHTFELVSGSGSADNSSFTISGNALKTAEVFDFETKSSYSIRLKVTDAGGLSYEKVLTITINDLDNEDTDGDGILDSIEKGSVPASPRDTDGDGIPDYRDTDSDGDGVPDAVELADGTDPYDKTKYKDTDGDMVPDYLENLDGTAPNDPKMNKDSDGEGVPDYVENIDGTDPNDPEKNKDTDGGGVPDYVETVLFPAYGLPATDPSVKADDNQDTDGDGVTDYKEILAGTNPNEAPANLSFTLNRQIVQQDKAITVMNPTVTRRVITYSISPALPAGLTINSTTGVISGTRTQALTGTVTYTITATNRGGSTTSTITLVYNTTPTDIASSKANIYEGNNVGDVIGLLSTTDIDNPETHTYTLVMSGTNAYDNKNFKISGNQLLADTTFNFDFKNSYVVRVRSTDSQGLFTEKLFTISISKRPVIYGTSSEAYIQSTFTGTNNVTTKPIVSKGYSSKLSIFGSDIRSVSWSPGTGLSSTTSSTPIFKHGSTVTYNVTITNTFGSLVVLPFTVEVRDDYFVKPTNIISSRQDGINDYFVVENIQNYPDNEVTIYDRNGKILTKMANYNNRWDGRINGKLLSTDTYYYLIRFTSNPKAIVKGFITVINN